MFSYIVGKVISINKKSITLENGYIGYLVNVNEPSKFEVNKIRKIWIHKHVYLNNKNNFVEEFYGFENFEQKQFFLNCITINGIGPKTAMSFLKNDISLLKSFIGAKDMDALEQLEGINKKFSYILVDHLADYYAKDKIDDLNNYSEAISALKSLGYNQDEINFALNQMTKEVKINHSELSDVISQAIKLISQVNESKYSKA